MLTEAALAGIRNHFVRTIDHCKYKANGAVYKALIRSTSVMNGSLIVTVVLNEPAGVDVTISEVQLYDSNGDLFLTKAENIKRAAAGEGVLYRFTFNVTEVEM